MKQIFALCAALLLMASCAAAPTQDTARQEERLTICATLFPQYDFARAVAGDRAEVTLLLPPGVESHSFEPTPADLARLTESDLLFYTGDAMEPWVASLTDGVLPDTVRVVDLSEGIELLDGGEDGHDHGHAIDPHIWTSPINAMEMVRGVADALCEADPEGETVYRANEEEYLDALSALDEQLREMVAQAQRRELAFGGRFAFHYLTEEYGLTAFSAYDSCSEETEPSAKAVAALVERIRQDQLPVIYYEELTEPKVARSIAQETGASLLLLHSCHNLSKEEREAGETYLSLMQQNVEHLREGLC